MQYCEAVFLRTLPPRAWTMTNDRRPDAPAARSISRWRWSAINGVCLIIRDMMFGNRRHFRELLTKSDEGISSNILADRLKTLLHQGIIRRDDDPSHKQKGIHSLTEQGIELLPILAQMAAWVMLNISPSARNSASATRLLKRRRSENCGRNSWANCARTISV